METWPSFLVCYNFSVSTQVKESTTSPIPNDLMVMLSEIDKPELIEFYGLWLKNNKVAKYAYKEMRPHVTDGTAEVMGSKYLNDLSKIKPELVMAAYGLDVHLWHEQLQEGLKAEKWNNFTGEREPDHKTRKPYHDKLGQMLGVEGKEANVQVNFFQFVKEQKNNYGI